jgi:23S rRNA pseudouridine2605 synthase
MRGNRSGRGGGPRREDRRGGATTNRPPNGSRPGAGGPSRPDGARGQQFRPSARTAPQQTNAHRGSTAPPAGDRPLKTLERVLSKAGLGSRTEAKSWIAAGRVQVNGVVERDPDRWVDLERDGVSFDGAPVAKAAPLYLLLHKPTGYITTYRDPHGRPTIYDLLPERQEYVFPVGRLDLDTSGLLLLTNDTQFAERLTNPEFKVPKTYAVNASRPLHDGELARLRDGLELKDGPTRPAVVKRTGESSFEITITEGRNRQVRRMVEAVGADVVELTRIAIGPLLLGDLESGKLRALTGGEVAQLRGT